MWQPIETVPYRQNVLLYSKPYGYNKTGDFVVGYANKEYVGNPEYKYTHWRPLPEPPTNGE